ncbi:hypothetical protein F3Y22_tig00109983pilonHSYRG00032 [Hibiscus syriacus]|uniref:Uncharacterized protein n=1 Tax=Hibiscus syriacus TaxID=106335 RepID=A0A6A3BST3_HIBSY|nr:hypothetical protein F3Y22_tig00109983pilonHSYRG00032 [Hibiscus syriacus]
MITSPEWNNTKWSKDPAGKRLTSIILQERFWRNIVYALKLTRPLVKVLKMVDGDKKSTMGYIYESVDRAKETIAFSFLHKEEHYKKAFEYIDARWDCQLHRPLHAAGLVPDLSTQYKIGEQLDLYQNAQGLFGNPMAVRQRKKSATDIKERTPHILLKEIDESNEWLMGHMDDEYGEEDDFVFDGDDLTWSAVDKASGASQATYSTRTSTSRDRGNLIDEEIE